MSTSKRKTNGKSAQVAAPQPSAKDVYMNVIRALLPRHKGDEAKEDEAATRVRMELACQKICGKPLSALKTKGRLTWTVVLDGAVALRWGCSPKTLRAFFPRPNNRPPRRRPKFDTLPAFFEDLQKYGAATFSEKGVLDRSSLDRGPDPFLFMRYTPAGNDHPLP